jgi:hypothetical protein
MKAKILAAAKMLEVSTERIFRIAYNERRGVIWALKGPEELHRLWLKQLIEPPPYVRDWLETRIITMH